ncbi:hypothetical protein HDU91_003027 [Kappamyces sp. JEL0680]|nr:hypothetical protein HDU91_003027 [Kappamyces sp. JEL0680]
MSADYVIRNATQQEWKDIVMEWCEKLQWNTVADDVAAMFEQDPQGFFVGILQGQIITSISGVRYGSNKGFLGFYVCLEPHRGKGYGLSIFQHAMNYLEGRDVALDGVEAQIKNYEKSGFHHSRWVVRHALVIPQLGALEPHADLIDVKQVPARDIQSYDHSVTKLDRKESFIRCFVANPTLKGLASLDPTTKQLAGIICIRKAADGYRCGPFYASTPQIASRLLKGLFAKWNDELKGQTFYIDLATENPEAVNLVAKEHGANGFFTMSRMWTSGKAVVEDLHQLYGNLSVELG